MHGQVSVLLLVLWLSAPCSGSAQIFRAGIVSGGLFVIVWDYLPIVSGQTPYAATGIYSLLLGFFISLICIVIVSLLTKAPSKEILDEFEKVNCYKESV